MVVAAGALCAPAAFADECDAFLNEAIAKDTVQYQDVSSLTAKINEEMDRSYDELKQHASQGGGGGVASILFGLIEVDGHGGGGGSSFETFKEDFHNHVHDFMNWQHATAFLTQLTNASVVQAAAECKSHREIIGYYVGAKDSADLTLALAYRPHHAPAAASVKVTSSVVSRNLAGEDLKKRPVLNGLQIGQWETRYVALTRKDITKASTVSVAFGGAGDVSVDIPGWMPKPVVVAPPAKAWHREDESGQRYSKTYTRTVGPNEWNRHTSTRFELGLDNARIYDVDFQCRSTSGPVDNCGWNWWEPPCKLSKRQIGGKWYGEDHNSCVDLVDEGRAFNARRWEQNANVAQDYIAYYEVWR
jgi:hypothetical protein